MKQSNSLLQIGKGTHLHVQPSAPGRAIRIVLWPFVASMGRVRRAWAVWGRPRALASSSGRSHRP